MSSNYLYLAVDLFVLLVPFALSFDKRLDFYKKWKAFLPASAITVALFGIWDIWFTSEGIWSFNPKYLTGFELAGLPIEEWLFFFCIPYACVFTYEVMRYYFPKEPLRRAAMVSNFAYVGISLLLALLVFDRWYTFYTALFGVIYLVLIYKLKRKRANGWFLLMYLAILIPFIVSNGVLTGIQFWEYDFINLHPERVSDQIVKYNNFHNLRVRIFSMPIDDLLYGWFMLFMNVSLYDIFLGRK